MLLWKVGTRDRDDHLKLGGRHWKKDHFWTKSYHVTSVANNVANPLFLYASIAWYVTVILINTFRRKYMAHTLTRNFKIHFYWYRYYAIVLCNGFMSILILILDYVMFFKSTIWYNISCNLNSLRCLVLEILSFELDDYRGFRAGGGVHKLFVGGVYLWYYRIYNYS